MVGLLIAALAASAPGPTAPAEDPRAARFALIVGVNHAGEPGLAILKYADDDAARYQDLFRLLGARTYLLTRLDENTRRLHPQAAAEARDPTRHELEEAVRELTSDVARAKAQGVPTVLYFIYAGHGNVDGDVGYLSLEDARLDGTTLARDVLTAIDADLSHVIVDACYSYFLAFGRGPGGSRRPLHDFTQTPELAKNDRWGLLLSTSSARESHEWDAFQAGVFSHEVRSGLYGAADANGDGWVSYAEMVSFIDKANAAIPNEKYRPTVFARPPRQTDQLADLRGSESRRIEIDGSKEAHYLIEDGRGVRLADFHNAKGQSLKLLHPAGDGTLYLRRVDSDEEYTIKPAPDVIALADLQSAAPRAQARGAAHEAFDLLFSLPFSSADVHALPLVGPDLSVGLSVNPPWYANRKSWGWGALGLGGAGGLVAGITAGLAASERNALAPRPSEADVAGTNSRISSYNESTLIVGAVGATAAVGGLLLLLWPEDSLPISAAVTPTGAQASWAFSFQ